MPSKLGVPLSRWSIAELGDHVRRSGLVASISDSTLWRWLDEDAIRPWQHRCWIFPRDPNFVAKAGPILDLYQRQWKGRRLLDDELVLSSDEKTSIQAQARIHPTVPTGPGRPMRVENEYERRGAWALSRHSTFTARRSSEGARRSRPLCQRSVRQVPRQSLL